MSETNEQRIAIAELRAAVENLVLAASRNKCAAIGFVFGADPAVMMRFGNIRETGPELAELYLRLCDMSDEKEAAGKTVILPIKPEGLIN